MISTFVEHEAGTPADASFEAITVARELAAETNDSLGAIVIGSVDDDLVERLGEYGVETIYELEHPELHPYTPEGWAAAVDQVIEEQSPAAVIGAGIERSQEILARVGARRSIPFAASCNEITPGEPYEIVRQRWGGSLLEAAALAGDPKLMSITPHERSASPAGESTTPAIESIALDIEDPIRVRIDRVEETDIEGIPLGEARVVVGGGRGVGSGDDFDILEELADELGGTVGSSRAAVNEGWRPHDDQIGLTGAKIAPEIYIACGISGAVQHWVGAKGAEHVMAINTDPEAAIIQKSDWAVIGDLHEVVPAITDSLRD